MRALPFVAVVLVAACHGSPGLLAEPGRPLHPCPPTPNCVSTDVSDEAHTMAPVPFAAAPERAQDVARAALQAEPRMRLIIDVPGYLRGEATSRIFRFVDDVEIVIDSTAHLFRFRSASRMGRSDMGVNRERMERVSVRLHEAGDASVPR